MVKIKKIELCPQCKAKFQMATSERIRSRKTNGLSVGRPRVVNHEKIRQYAQLHPLTSQKTIAKVFRIGISTVCRILKNTENQNEHSPDSKFESDNSINGI